MNMYRHNPKVTMFETDDRFPSGPWIGFWIQKSMGKCSTQCHLSFCDGKVTGFGADIVGKFDMSGAYDIKTGHCVLTKQYLSAHSVQYDGACENNQIWYWGLWKLPGDRGGFHLWPESVLDPTQHRLNAKKNVPVNTRLVGSSAICGVS